MNKHTVAVTAALGAPLGFLAGILYCAWREHDQSRQKNLETQAASLEKLRAQTDEIAYHQRTQWNTIHALQGELRGVSKGSEKQPS